MTQHREPEPALDVAGSDVRQRVLVVDDEAFIREALKLYLQSHGFDVAAADGANSALSIFESGAFDLVLLDLAMPEIDGLELLRRFKRADPNVEIIIATGCGSVNSAIEALRLGAFDYITKPILDFDRDLLSVMNLALARTPTHLTVSTTDPGWVGLDYYNELEQLARAVTKAATREEAIGLVEPFFAMHFNVHAGAAWDADGADATFSPLWGWDTDSAVEHEPWLAHVHALTDRWTPVPSDCSPPTPDETDGVQESWRLDLGVERGLVLIRRRQSGVSCTAPTSLLALVIHAVLAKEPVPA